MKKTLITTALIALGVAMAGQASAAADVTGTVLVKGSVAEKCRVILGGTRNSGSFSGTIDLEELADPVTGYLKTPRNESIGTGTSTTTTTFQVSCSGSKVTVGLEHEQMTIGGVAAVAPASGYANTINFKSTAKILRAGDAGTLSLESTGALVTTPLGSPISNQPGNVEILVSDFSTLNPTAILEAGNYQGKITFTLSPTVVPPAT